jgi:hypothetical protein
LPALRPIGLRAYLGHRIRDFDELAFAVKKARGGWMLCRVTYWQSESIWLCGQARRDFCMPRLSLGPSRGW